MRWLTSSSRRSNLNWAMAKSSTVGSFHWSYSGLLQYLFTYWLQRRWTERNGIGDRSSNLGWGHLCFLLYQCPREKHESIYGKTVGQTGFFCLSQATSLGEEKLWIQANCTPLENWPFSTSCPWRRGWVNTFCDFMGTSVS